MLSIPAIFLNAPSKTERAKGYLFSLLKIGLQLILRQKLKAVKKKTVLKSTLRQDED